MIRFKQYEGKNYSASKHKFQKPNVPMVHHQSKPTFLIWTTQDIDQNTFVDIKVMEYLNMEYKPTNETRKKLDGKFR